MRQAHLLTLIPLLALSAAATAMDGTEEVAEALFSDEILVLGEPVYLVPIPPGKAFEVAFKVGELDIEARPVREARLELRADCRETEPETCRRKLAKVELTTRELDDRIRVELRGLSRRDMKKLGIEGTVIVPRSVPLFVKMGIGDLEIDAGPQDLQVGMSIGDLTVRAARETVASVGISTRIGDATLRGDDYLEGRRRLLIGARVNWLEGEGDARIDVKLGIGDAKVYLE